jgi:hypothetical protein
MGGPIRLAVPVSRREGSSIVCKQESERNARRRMNHLTGVVVARYLALFLVFAPGCLGAGDRAQGTSLRNATHSEARRDVSGALRHQHRLERNVRETYVDHAGQTRAFVEHPEPVISAITRYDYLPTRESASAAPRLILYVSQARRTQSIRVRALSDGDVRRPDDKNRNSATAKRNISILAGAATGKERAVVRAHDGTSPRVPGLLPVRHTSLYPAAVPASSR